MFGCWMSIVDDKLFLSLALDLLCVGSAINCSRFCYLLLAISLSLSIPLIFLSLISIITMGSNLSLRQARKPRKADDSQDRFISQRSEHFKKLTLSLSPNQIYALCSYDWMLLCHLEPHQVSNLVGRMTFRNEQGGRMNILHMSLVQETGLYITQASWDVDIDGLHLNLSCEYFEVTALGTSPKLSRSDSDPPFFLSLLPPQESAAAAVSEPSVRVKPHKKSRVKRFFRRLGRAFLCGCVK